MRWAWNADCMGQVTNPYDVRVGKTEGKKKIKGAFFPVRATNV
jgi:hypothetical protein